ncbi:MAG: arginine repressor [Eubacteriales bacterium]|nr:arginine repressor [bacterium]MDY2791224.1 arginine repressor [Eubacteriales bacterium]
MKTTDRVPKAERVAKAERQDAILRAIEENHIDTQEQLAEALRQAGMQVTQATISRDIRELGLSKIALGNGNSRYATLVRTDDVEKNERLGRIFAESVLSVAQADNLIIIKTLSGSGSAAAELIDSLPWPEIVGTLAGDNTIFVAVQSREKVHAVIQRFQEMLRK